MAFSWPGIAWLLFLLGWWDEHGRHDIPWKQASASGQPDPYGIWIAEVMLQQTQLQVALPYWQRWMEAFPTVDALAVLLMSSRFCCSGRALAITQGRGGCTRQRSNFKASVGPKSSKPGWRSPALAAARRAAF